MLKSITIVCTCARLSKTPTVLSALIRVAIVCLPGPRERIPVVAPAARPPAIVDEPSVVSVAHLNPA